MERNLNHSIPQKQVLHGKKANKKFSFPYQDWSEADFKPSKEQPEFRGRETYSSVLDDKNDYIYILFSGGTASFEEEVEDEEDEEKKVVKLLKHIPTLMNLKYGAVV